MARIVHVDHRAEELAHLDREIDDVRTFAGAEQFGLLAGLDHVAVTHKRIEASACRQDDFAIDLDCQLFAEEQLVAGTELSEHALPH